MATITDTANTSFQLAANFVNYTNSTVFLTGKAGTGKTTFLKYCKENEKKNTAIVAPTGVAAINAGGTTIHSFFQLPFTPFIPAGRRFGIHQAGMDKHGLIAKLRLTNDRKEVMQQLELLIIDEISMVRCDVLDAIDTVLQHVRNRPNQPFGGVQVLLIGDMHQLPPVAKEEEWQLLSPYYKSPYFFSSLVIESQPPVYVELNTIYRQKDHRLIELLNKVRNNEMDQHAFDILYSRYQPKFKPAKEDGYITLTTHNHKADVINHNALSEVEGRTFLYKATITGDFSEKAYPAEVELHLKVGAQVMFIKNDIEKVRRYFNGKIGVVTILEGEKIMVHCTGDATPIEVKKETWRNIRYSVDKATNHIEENELGSFSQFPLRLAWAITIHKSQGLTFEKAIIDAGDAFAPGQVYVALSRCTSLEGMILHSHIQTSSLHSDERIKKFSGLQKTSTAQMLALNEAMQQFQNNEILALFDFTHLQRQAQDLVLMINTHLPSFNNEPLSWMLALGKKLEDLQITSAKFLPQLNHLLVSAVLPENNTVLQNRLVAACGHFVAGLEKAAAFISQCPVVTHNKLLAIDLNKAMNELYKNICGKHHLLSGCLNGFEVNAYLATKRSFVKPALPVNFYAGKLTGKNYPDNPYPELFGLLRKKRDEICNTQNLTIYLVANNKSLDEMAKFLPQTFDELNQVSGFGLAKTKLYGEAFLTIINDYCELNNLHSNMEMKPDKNKRKEKSADLKTNTKLSSFHLFKTGKTIGQISAERKLTVATIENHLSFFVGTGEIDINCLISKDKQILVQKAIEKNGFESLKAIVEECKQQVTYGEVKLLAATIKNK